MTLQEKLAKYEKEIEQITEHIRYDERYVSLVVCGESDELELAVSIDSLDDEQAFYDLYDVVYEITKGHFDLVKLDERFLADHTPDEIEEGVVFSEKEGEESRELLEELRDNLVARMERDKVVEQQVLTEIDKMSDRDRILFGLRCGLADGKKWTWAEIAEQFHIHAYEVMERESSIYHRLFGSKDFWDKLFIWAAKSDQE